MTDAQLRFHASLYPPAAVARAVERFASVVAEATVLTRDSDTLVVLSGIPANLAARLPDELANHVLFETILERRATP